MGYDYWVDYVSGITNAVSGWRICPKCESYYYDYGLGFYSTCWKCKNKSSEVSICYQSGWICPRCEKVHAPSIKTCTCVSLKYVVVEEGEWVELDE